MSESPSQGGCPVVHTRTDTDSSMACPVKGGSGKPVMPNIFLPNTPAFPSAKQIKEESGLHIVGDAFPDSKPTDGQRFLLSPIPAQSTIPKSSRARPPVPPADAPIENLKAAGFPIPEPLACTSDDAASTAPPSSVAAPPPVHEDETWTFPSHQRFYNAMKKKGWHPKEEEIPYIVSIHNTINERTWREVMRYEQLHEDECKTPKLMKFQGLPTDYSVKARLKSAVGYVLPFDRHDWTIDRCGKEVRYVIDFYQGRETFDPTLPAAVHLDVRPAPTAEGVIDRLRVYIQGLFR